MKVEPQNVMKEEWDYLIVIDACRYDLFKKNYKNYLEGELEKRKSKGSNTAEWLQKTFTDYYGNITYISANPFINSKGISLKEISPGENEYDWKATEHFGKIIDVWEFGWDKSLGTVPPFAVNKACLSRKNNNRTIIHYMQPHKPYLTLENVSSLQITKRVLTKKERENKKPLSLVKESIGEKLEDFLKRENYWRVKEILRRLKVFNISRAVGDEKAWKMGDVFYYYRDNLKRVLKAVSNLVRALEGHIIITSDHGEAFGEHNVWLHSSEVHIPTLLIVPWLVVS